MTSQVQQMEQIESYIHEKIDEYDYCLVEMRQELDELFEQQQFVMAQMAHSEDILVQTGLVTEGCISDLTQLRQ